MAKAIVMPKPGITVEECILSKWHKNVGDTVKKGDILFSYETDKASFDETSEEEGELLAVFYNEGDDVPALNNICAIGTRGEDVSAFRPNGDAPTATAPAPTTASNPAPAAVAPPETPINGPVAKAVVMPKPGITVEECILSKWHKKVGDTVSKGELLFSYETDKASFDEASEEDGKLLAVFYNEGDDVPALGNVCAIGADGDAFAHLGATGGSIESTATVESAEPTKTAVQVAEVTPQVVFGTSNGVSPRAKSLATKNGIDSSSANGTGPNGRVIERDIKRVMANGPENSPTAATIDAVAPTTTSNAVLDAYEDIPHTTVRKVIAKAMHASLSGMAQVTLNSSFDATEIMKLRASFKNSKDPRLEKITLNDLVLFATVKVLLKHPEMNANYFDDKTRRFNTVNLGVAVDTEKGLLVPKIMTAEKLTLPELSAEMKRVAVAAQSGSISPDLLAGGTFTVTNLGNLGVESFTPVINPPEVGILGVCSITERVKTVGGKLTSYQSMGLSLTFDHRAIDGAPAAKFLKDVCEALTSFSLLLVE